MPVTLIFGDTFTASFVTEMIGHFTVKHLSQQPTEHMDHKIFRILYPRNRQLNCLSYPKDKLQDQLRNWAVKEEYYRLLLHSREALSQ